MHKKHQIVKRNYLTYEELLNLPSDYCVNVNRTYFYLLMAKGEIKNIKSLEYWQIFSKYIEIEKIQNYLEGSKNISAYYLMSVSEIKFLMNFINDIPRSKTTFLKSNIKVSELNEIHQKIITKKQKSSIKAKKLCT